MSDLGQRLKQARLEAGLSQRELCGDVITRNMLSQIENGAARPSMDTLGYLARRLGKSIGWFLDEGALESPNAGCIHRAREAFDRGDHAGVLAALEAFQEPDAVFSREKGWMEYCALLRQAEWMLEDGRRLYALELLERARSMEERSGLGTWDRRQRLLLLGKASGTGMTALCQALPSLDPELELRARAAMESRDFSRAAGLLECMEDRSTPRWNWLRGAAFLGEKQYEQAVAPLLAAESEFPQVLPLLEECFRELGDYRRAYEYACKQKK